MQPLSSVAPAALAGLLRAMPLSDGKVAFAWSSAVGPAVVRATCVKLDRGVLLVDASTAAWSREVVRSSALILTRLQSVLGRDIVTRIEVRTVR